MAKLKIEISVEALSFIEPLKERISTQFDTPITSDNVIGSALREMYEKEFLPN